MTASEASQSVYPVIVLSVSLSGFDGEYPALAISDFALSTLGLSYPAAATADAS